MLNITIFKASDYKYIETATVAESEFFAYVRSLINEYGCQVIVDVEECGDVQITIYDDYLE